MKKRHIKIKNNPGIYRVMFADGEGKLIPPERGLEFMARYSVKENGKAVTKSAYCSSLTEAKKIRANGGPVAVSEPEPAAQPAAAVNDMRFVDALELWKETYLPLIERSTRINVLSRAVHFEFFGAYTMRQINSKAIYAWLKHVKEPSYLARFKSTRESYIYEWKTLRAFFNFYRENVDETYPLPFLSNHTKHLGVRKVLKEKKDLTIPEFNRFMGKLREQCTGDEIVFVYVALFQYAIYGRIQDAAALQFEDFGETSVLVRRKVQFIREKGQHALLVAGSKCGEGKEIPMTPFLKKILSEWKLLSGSKRKGPLFTYKEKTLSYPNIRYRYNRALKAAGIRFTGTHLIRHASLTEVQDKTKDVKLTAKLAGHKSVTSTYRYIDARSDQVREIQERMSKELLAAMDA